MGFIHQKMLLIEFKRKGFRKDKRQDYEKCPVLK
jgi:hypothetical protein